MTSRELVKSVLRFNGADRLPYDFPERYGSDFTWTGMNPSPDSLGNADLSIKSWVDEWGCRWERIGDTLLGEVKGSPLEDWGSLDRLSVPDVLDENRWIEIADIRKQAGDTYILCGGISLYTRVSFLRGTENTWIDIYENSEELCALIDVMVEMDKKAIEKYSSIGGDGIILADDWGVQNALQIPPDKWREIWKPRYKAVIDAAHKAGMDFFLHSCGYIVEIIDDLIEIGLDAFHMDQQMNMGLDLLGSRFKGKVNFFAPADIQRILTEGTIPEIKQYCREMVHHLHTPKGGLIPRWYIDPVGAGHREEAVNAMCEEFFAISKELYGN